MKCCGNCEHCIVDFNSPEEAESYSCAKQLVEVAYQWEDNNGREHEEIGYECEHVDLEDLCEKYEPCKGYLEVDE